MYPELNSGDVVMCVIWEISVSSFMSRKMRRSAPKWLKTLARISLIWLRLRMISSNFNNPWKAPSLMFIIIYTIFISYNLTRRFSIVSFVVVPAGAKLAHNGLWKEIARFIMMETRRSDVLTLLTRFYDLSVSRHPLSKSKHREICDSQGPDCIVLWEYG